MNDDEDNERSDKRSGPGMLLGDDFHRFFVFSENILLENNGSTVRALADYDVNLMNNLVQCTSISLSSKCPLYRMKVTSLRATDKACILFGLTSKCYIGHPTWVIKHSIRYHSDTGGVFNGGPGLHSDNPYTEGDVISCQVEHFHEERSLVNFSRNGRLVFRQWVSLRQNQLFPTIGFENGPAVVTVEWPLTDLSQPLQLHDLNQWIGCRSLSVDTNNMAVTLVDIDDSGKQSFSLQAPRPLNRERRYFEVTVVRRPNYQGALSVGLTGAVYDRFHLPGCDPPSIAYHAHAGSVVHGTRTGHDYQSDDCKCQEGDRLGCGLIYLSPVTHEREEQSVLVYFTKNSKVIYHKCVLQQDAGFYAAIGLGTKLDKVRVDMSASSPLISDSQIKSWSNQRSLYQWFRYYPTLDFLYADVSHGRKVRQRRNQDRITLVQCLKTPLSEMHRYFKVKMTSQGSNGGVCVGVASRSFPNSDHHLGCDEYSCGYSGSQGTLSTAGTTIHTEKLKTGDEISCYLEYSSSVCHILIFAKNQTARYRVKMAANGDKLYASVTFDSTADDQPIDVDIYWPHTVLPAALPKYTMTYIASWLHPPAIRIIGREMTLKKKEIYVCYFNAQSPEPLTKSGLCYFEVRLLTSISGSWPSIGLSPAVFHHSVKLGSISGSIAYSPDRGEVLTHSNPIKFNDDHIYKCVSDDRIGCGVVQYDTNTMDDHREEQSVIVYFTKNGDVLYHSAVKMLTGGMYPTVCFEKEGDSVEVLTALPPSVHHQNMAHEWIKEANMNMPYKQSSTVVDFGKDMMMDLIEYTNVVDDYKEMYGITSSKSDQSLTINYSIYISHVADDTEKAHHLLEILSMEGHEVVMSTWNRTLEDVSLKSNDVDAIIVCLSNAYIHDDGRFQEFIILKSKSKPLVPVVLDALMTWPPRGHMAIFQSDFTRAESVRVDGTGGDTAWIDTSDLLWKIQQACNVKQTRSRSAAKREMKRVSLPVASVHDHYYPRHRRGMSMSAMSAHDGAGMRMPGTGSDGMMRTMVCTLL